MFCSHLIKRTFFFLIKTVPGTTSKRIVLRSLSTTMAEGDGGSTQTSSDVMKKPVEMSTVTEGRASIVQPSSVFYNPVQEFNRDLTIAVISEFATEHVKESKEKARKWAMKNAMKEAGGASVPEMEVEAGDEELVAGTPHEHGLKILEGLSASGLRSMRFGLEIPGVNKVIANDFDQTAVEIIQQNIEKNGLEALVEASHADASLLMHQHKANKNRFDVIDLDPYGSAAPFLDSAVQAVRDGGLLCVTSTDAAVLCGNGAEKCFTQYGAMSLRGKFCHEMALRIILRAIDAHANKYSRYIVPLISLSVDFYFRVFVRVYSGQYKAKFSASKTGMVYNCTGCGSFEVQPLCTVHPTKGGQHKFVPATGPPVSKKCEHCGFKHQVGGPIYISRMHDNEFIDKVITRVTAQPDLFKTSPRIVGMLSMAAEELDVPLYYEMDGGLCQVLHCTPPRILQIRSAILHAGYQVSFSHACKNSLKTNAPSSVIWDIMRAWVEKKPVNEKRLLPGTAARAILEKKAEIKVCFGNHPDANPKSRADHLKRWQPNPEKDWGPKPRAKRSQNDDSCADRRLKNQGKRRKKTNSVDGGQSSITHSETDDQSNLVCSGEITAEEMEVENGDHSDECAASVGKLDPVVDSSVSEVTNTEGQVT